MLECIVIIVSTVRILHPVIHEMVRLTTGRTLVVGLFLYLVADRILRRAIAKMTAKEEERCYLLLKA